MLAGCGSSGGGGGSLPTVKAAATKTLAGTAVTNVTLNGTTAFDPIPANVDAKAASSFPEGLGYAAIYLPAARSAPEKKWFLVFLPTKVYLTRSPSLAAVLPSGKTWASIDVGSGSIDERSAAFVAQVEGINPQLLLDEIAWGAVSSSPAHDSVIDHVPYSEYVVTVNLKRALSSATGAIRVAIQAQLDALKATPSSGSRLVQITILTDALERVTRMQAVLPGSKLGAVSMKLVQFGTTVGKSLPPASQVTDLTSVAPSAPSPWMFGPRR